MTTKPTTDCKGGQSLCQYDSATRTKFFHGMLLTDEHLRAEQAYHRDALKRVNRYLWGSGIVCGFEVEEAGGLCIKVHPGLALDCHGNVIEMCKCITIDLSEECRKAYPDGCYPAAGAKELSRCLVIRYAEIAADQQPVLSPDNDCTPPGAGKKCETSKYREGFCLEIRDDCELPKMCSDDEGLLPIYQRYQGTPEAQEAIRKRRPHWTKLAPRCPSCGCDCGCEDCLVCLVELKIECDKNKVTLDPGCRQYVWSPNLLRTIICGVMASFDAGSKGVGQAAKPRGVARDLMVNRPLDYLWGLAEVHAEGDRYTRLEKRVEELADIVEKLQPKRPPKPPGQPPIK